MIVTKEHEIIIDETKYIPYMKITKYHTKVPNVKKAIVIDFENETFEIHRTKPGTSLLNLTLYDIPEDSIKDALELFGRDIFMKESHHPLTTWIGVKFYDLEGHKQMIKIDPKDENHPIFKILQWLKEEYGDVMEMM